MEDYNTATLPHKKFYNLNRWHAKEAARVAQHGGAGEVRLTRVSAFALQRLSNAAHCCHRSPSALRTWRMSAGASLLRSVCAPKPPRARRSSSTCALWVSSTACASSRLCKSSCSLLRKSATTRRSSRSRRSWRLTTRASLLLLRIMVRRTPCDFASPRCSDALAHPGFRPTR